MTAQKAVIPTAEGLAASVRAAPKRGNPPVERWDPPFCGDIDMRIARDGQWFYLGTPIQRPELVRLFSSILKREGDEFYLVTPVEKVGITVDDAPFVAVDFLTSGTGEGQSVAFETNVGDFATASHSNPIRVATDPATQEPAPYIMIRRGLEALIDRKSFYRLVDQAVHREGWFGVWSEGCFFPICPSADLEEN